MTTLFWFLAHFDFLFLLNLLDQRGPKGSKGVQHAHIERERHTTKVHLARKGRDKEGERRKEGRRDRKTETKEEKRDISKENERGREGGRGGKR